MTTTTNHAAVETEMQAEIANRINLGSREAAKLLKEISEESSWMVQKLDETMSISMNVQTLVSKTTQLAKIQARLDVAMEMADMVGLTEAQLEVAVAPVRTWFHTEV